jgi:hypothetical protein
MKRTEFEMSIIKEIALQLKYTALDFFVSFFYQEKNERLDFLESSF